MWLPFFSKPTRLSEEEIRKTMDELRSLRLEVAVTELETELRRSNVRVLRPKGIGWSRLSPSRSSGRIDLGKLPRFKG
jgi:hypothetical protein